MRTAYSLLLSLLCYGACAQNAVDFNNYQLLKCSGTIPQDFLTLTKDKYAADVKRENDSAGGKADQDILDFYLETDYTIDDMLMSGKVLFGDPATEYVNKVAAIVLADQPDLKGKLRFYCLRSYEVNAFSTQQGMVFVTLGLLAKVNNEAELAFVLSHEIAHYEKEHNLIEFLKKREFNSNATNRSTDADQTIRLVSNYSKELELEADSLGILRLMKTPYACSQSLTLMDVLRDAERPYIDRDFNFNLLESSIMKLPSKYVVDSLEHISVEKDDNTDDLSTHPNTELRKTALQRILSGQNATGAGFFIAMDSASFFQMRKMCRFECVHFMLNKGKYCDAAFTVSALMSEEPNSIYLKRSMGMALYGIAKFKRQNLFYGFMQKIYYQSTSQQKLYYALKLLTRDAMTAITFRYLYDLSLTDASVGTHSMLYDIAYEQVFYGSLGSGTVRDYYKNYQYDLAHENDTTLRPKQDSAAAVKVDNDPHHQSFNSTPKPKSKDEKSGKGEVTNDDGQGGYTRRANETQFFLLAFADIVDSSLFRTLLDTAHQRQSRNDYANYHRDDQLDIPALGIDTLIIAQPVYQASDDRHLILYERSETQQLLFSNDLQQNADKSKLVAEVFNPRNLKADEVDRFNDIAVINDWGLEVFSHNVKMNFIPIETDRMLTVAHKYNTNHVCFTGIYDIDRKKKNRGLFKRTTYYTFIFNAVNAAYELNKVYQFNQPPRPANVDVSMYDLMGRIHD